MSDGYEGIITPMKTKQFEAMVEDVRGHFNGNGARLQTVGADLRRLLPHAENVRGRRGFFGADLSIAAWQVARQFAQAEAAQRASAAAVTRAYQIYYGTFHVPQSSSSTGGRFDAA